MIRLLIKLIRTIKNGDNKMSAATDALTAAVIANTTAVNNAVAALSNGGANDALIQAAATQINTNTQALATATPAVAAPVVPSV